MRTETTVLKIERQQKPLIGLVRFVIKAKSNDENAGSNLNLVQIKQNTMAASDGHRLHIADLAETGIDAVDGLYEVVKNKASEVVLVLTDKEAFPDYEKIMCFDDVSHMAIPLTHEVNTDAAYIIRNMPDSYINYRYLEDVGDFADTAFVPRNGEQIIAFVGSDGTRAAIMPMRNKS